MSIKEEILQAIKTLVKKEIQKQSQSRDVVSVVTGIKGNKYEVKINNSTYWIKNGVGINLSVGNQVWVHIPNGNLNEMFIMAKR